MRDRGMKKWAPFNSVVPNKELLRKENGVNKPDLSKDEISDYEELLKESLYTGVKVTISYLENNQIKKITDTVIDLDPIKKNIILKTKIINFRQIYRVY